MLSLGLLGLSLPTDGVACADGTDLARPGLGSRHAGGRCHRLHRRNRDQVRRLTFNLDIAIALGLVGFLATIAFARFVLHRGSGASRTPEAGPSAMNPLCCKITLPALLLVIGSLFSLTAAVGLLRPPDLYTRMHAASKAGTLGSCVMLLALAIHSDDLRPRCGRWRASSSSS